jgi:hypothetical protein
VERREVGLVVGVVSLRRAVEIRLKSIYRRVKVGIGADSDGVAFCWGELSEPLWGSIQIRLPLDAAFGRELLRVRFLTIYAFDIGLLPYLCPRLRGCSRNKKRGYCYRDQYSGSPERVHHRGQANDPIVSRGFR